MDLNKISFMSQAHFDEMGSTEDQNISLVSGVAVPGTKTDVIPITSATEATYIASADGYVILKASCTNNTPFYVYSSTTGLGYINNSVTPAKGMRAFTRVSKGDVVLLKFTGTDAEAFFAYDK